MEINDLEAFTKLTDELKNKYFFDKLNKHQSKIWNNKHLIKSCNITSFTKKKYARIGLIIYGVSCLALVGIYYYQMNKKKKI